MQQQQVASLHPTVADVLSQANHSGRPKGLGNRPACSASGTLAAGLNVCSTSNVDCVHVSHQGEHVQFIV